MKVTIDEKILAQGTKSVNDLDYRVKEKHVIYGKQYANISCFQGTMLILN